MEKILITLGIIIITGAIIYGASLLITVIGMWALTKAGILAAWTWKQAALVAIAVMVIICLTGN